MPRLKLITFDLDNTLWNVDPVIVRAEQRMRSWLAERVPGFASLFPPERMFAMRDEVIAGDPQMKHDISRLREEMLYRAIRQCGYPPLDARSLAHQAFKQFFDARHAVEFFEGALETLAVLANHFVLGALTNGNADFRKLKLDRYFSFGFSAASVGASKPAPNMFQAALEHARARPTEAVHVGDHPIDDIRGAAAVGMHTIWVNLETAELPAETPAPTDTVIRVHDIPAAVARIDAKHA